MTSISGAAPTRAQLDATTANATKADDVPLEPEQALPTIKPYKAGVGGWIGTGVGTVLGGAVGAGLGALALGALSARVGGGFFGPAQIGMLVGGGVGALAGGFGIYEFNKSSYEQREHARIQADFGTSTLQFARDMIAKWDHDKDGSINLVNTTGLQSQDERVYTETRQQSRTERHYDFWEDEWDTTKVRWTEERGHSAARVWEAADVAPKDDTVTEVELARLMAKFDANRDGALTTPEQEAFRAAHPVITDQWRAR